MHGCSQWGVDECSRHFAHLIVAWRNHRAAEEKQVAFLRYMSNHRLGCRLAFEYELDGRDLLSLQVLADVLRADHEARPFWLVWLAERVKELLSAADRERTRRAALFVLGELLLDDPGAADPAALGKAVDAALGVPASVAPAWSDLRSERTRLPCQAMLFADAPRHAPATAPRADALRRARASHCR